VKQPLFRRIWGEATDWLGRSRPVGWADLLFVVGLAGLVFGLVDVTREWTGVHREVFTIDLESPWELLRYTVLSLSRGLLAYLLSLAFTMVYGYWAAKDRVADRVLLPLLDILQSIPVLSILPVLVLGLMAAFPYRNIGLNLAAVVMIFTGQAWNMTFSLYHSLRSVPQDQQEAATVYRFTWWERFKWVELPFATVGLVWNSMMSMAGGWFFLTVNEAFQLGEGHDFRLPGLGSYMSVAVDQGNKWAMVRAVVAMILMIVALDQLLWRPLVVWAQKFRVEEGGAQEEASSWFLNRLRRSHLLGHLAGLARRLRVGEGRPRARSAEPEDSGPAPVWAAWLSRLVLAALVLAMAYGAWRLLELLYQVSRAGWMEIGAEALWTLGRVLLATLLGTLWALPAGLAIGLSPRLSRVLQPVVQIAASFPAPMLFPVVIAVLQAAGVSLNWGSILLMLLGTQWYILFNVIAGAMAIPADLREAARSYHIVGWQRFWILYLPAVFPFLVTGWVTAAGGAWNASIVAEYVTFKGQVLQAHGLGAHITQATRDANFPVLAASTLTMSLLVVVFNRLVWRRCYRLAEERFSLSK
jgi:NitT/TauT family transport system permease protein